MNRESVASWIGLKLNNGFEVVDFLEVGGQHAVFKIVQDENTHVLRVLKSHLGFAIDLPPNEIFPELSKRQEYTEQLITRLRTICGSPLLARIAPLEELWTALAVQHLRAPDPNWQSVSTQEYDALAESQFVWEKLNDWSMIAVGKSSEEMHDMIVIYEGDKPIYADFPELLARDAAEALKRLNDLKSKRKGIDPSNKLNQNPILPWMAAAATGYTLPAEAADEIADALGRCEDLLLTMTQAGQVAYYIKRDMSVQKRSGLMAFILEVIKKTPSAGAAHLGVFLKPWPASRKDG